MNFAELIRLSNRIENLTMQDLQREALSRFSLIMYESNVPEAGVDDIFRQNLNDQNKIIQTAFSHLEQDLNILKEEVRRQIEIEGVKWLQTSSTLYEKQLATRDAQQANSVNLHRNKPVQLSDESAKILNNRVASYNNWQYPAMIIHPMLENFVELMVGNDPLYLVDESPYLLEPTLSRWNDAYRSRLRTYHIEESFDHPILDKLPNNQFGFCLCYNYLNYRPYELIKKYLEEIYQKLKPGGVLAMTFNDCDRFQAIQMVEQHITCYTPGSLIKGYANFLGFEQIFQHDDGSASVWIELKKPGQLTSLRGGQALAKIMPKELAQSK